jgi:uncharacterized protein (TIGR03067 family)
MKKHRAVAAALAGAIALACSQQPASATQSAAQRDYQRLSGRWQLTRAYINGRAVPAAQVHRTMLITDGNRFWFPKAKRAATHPAGTFTIDPGTVPKQVDSKASGGSNAGVTTRGIYRIYDARHQVECWGTPGGARPHSFTSSSCAILQYWTKIGPVPKGY